MKLCMKCMEQYADQLDCCPNCGYRETDDQNSASLLPQQILVKRYLVGHVLHTDRQIITYVGWDEYLQSRVLIEEYYPAEIACRSNTDQITVQPRVATALDALWDGCRQFVYELRRMSVFRPQGCLLKPIDCFRENGTVYAVLQYPRGKTVEERIQAKPFDESEAIGHLTKILSFLAVLHENGFVLRSLSPDRVLIGEDDQVYLTNFRKMAAIGSASDADARTADPFTPMDAFYGTVQPSSDIYAASALLYTMLTGEAPAAPADRTQSKLTFRPSNPVTPNTQKAICNAMQPRQADRTATVRDFLQELTGHAEEKAVAPTTAQKAQSQRMKKLLVIGASCICIAVAGVSIGNAISGIRPTGNFMLRTDQIKVPLVVNMDEHDAEQLLLETGLHVARDEGMIYNEDLAKGLIVLQDPPSGTPVDPDSTVTIFVCQGAMPLMMPSLLNVSREEAEACLAGMGLTGVQFAGEGVRVVEQDPAPNTVLTEDMPIVLTLGGKSVTEYPLTVPAVLYMLDWERSTVEAEKLQKQSGSFLYEIRYLEENDPLNLDSSGIVVKIEYDGRQVEPGETVTVKADHKTLVLYLTSGRNVRPTEAPERQPETQKATTPPKQTTPPPTQPKTTQAPAPTQAPPAPTQAPPAPTQAPPAPTQAPQAPTQAPPAPTQAPPAPTQAPPVPTQAPPAPTQAPPAPPPPADPAE